jgi:hypothetical protein
LREVMRQNFQVGRRRRAEAIAQNFSDAVMQDPASTFEQIFVGRVLNERVLEMILGDADFNDAGYIAVASSGKLVAQTVVGS